MNRGEVSNLAWTVLACTFLLPRLLWAVEIVPATAYDITKALGPDAKGLDLMQEDLPDLFDLTASRIEENSAHFTVEAGYANGRWAGGKAVIEYARDLSYTIVSIYNKEGKRQRIYSVKTRYTEHVARQRSEPRERQKEPEPDLTVTYEPEEQRSSPSRSSRPDASKKRESAPVQETRTAAEGSAGAAGYEWDEASGSYVPVGQTAAAPAPKPDSEETPKSRKRGRQPETAVASARVSNTAPSPAAVPTPSVGATSQKSPSGLWLPTKPQTESAAPNTVKVADTTWVEKPAEKTPEPPPASTKSRRRREKAAETKAAEPEPKPDTAKPSEEWVPKSIQKPTRAAEEPPSKTINVDNEIPERAERARRAQRVERAERLERAEKTEAAARSTRAARKETPPPPAERPAPVVKKEEPAPEPRRVAESRAAEGSVPSTEELLAGDEAPGPDTNGADSWKPKTAAKSAPAAEEPVVSEPPVKVASVPKQAPADNSVDALLRAAERGAGQMPTESAGWTPKKTAAAKPDVDLNKELERVRKEEKQRAAAAKPAVKIRTDVNNPEEGVLPVSSFEKFSGPMYGRHREYERRFRPGKNANAKAPVHDFYVDEVDRKKEIHNIYFYKHEKGKAPKLVAVQRHSKVSFLSNYDIDKEDAGKISTY